MAETMSQSNPPVLAEELNSIAARAQTYTGASGAAIALSEGDVSEAVCRACSGPSAPDVGVHLRLEGTFTGMAVQSGQALRCDDSDTDRRVDAAACRALGTRSIVVVPIRDADTEAVAGVLAVFAGTKNAFNDLHVAVLRTMAREVAVAVQKARKAGISLSTLNSMPIAPPAPARPVSSPGFTPSIPAPVAPTPAPVAVPVSAPQPSSYAAAAASSAPEPAATLMSPTPTPRPMPAPPPPPTPIRKVEAPTPISEEALQPVAAPIAPSRRTSAPAPPAPEWKPAPPPPSRKADTPAPSTASRSEASRAESSRSAAASANFGTFDSVGQDKKPGGGGMGIWIGVAAAVVLIVGGYFAYTQFSGKPATPATQTAQQQAAPANSAPANTTPAPATTTPPASTSTATNAASSTTQPPKGATQTQSAPAQPKPAPVQQPPAQQPPAPQTQAKPSPQAVERAAVTPSSSPRSTSSWTSSSRRMPARARRGCST